MDAREGDISGESLSAECLFFSFVLDLFVLSDRSKAKCSEWKVSLPVIREDVGGDITMADSSSSSCELDLSVTSHVTTLPSSTVLGCFAEEEEMWLLLSGKRLLPSVVSVSAAVVWATLISQLIWSVAGKECMINSLDDMLTINLTVNVGCVHPAE